MGKDLRTHLLDNTNVENLIGFENKGIFTAIDDRYRFAILTFRYGGELPSYEAYSTSTIWMWFIVSKKKQLASLVTCSPATRQRGFSFHYLTAGSKRSGECG